MTTNTVISVSEGSTRVPHSISLDFIRRSMKALNIYFRVLNRSLTSATLLPVLKNKDIKISVLYPLPKSPFLLLKIQSLELWCENKQTDPEINFTNPIITFTCILPSIRKKKRNINANLKYAIYVHYVLIGWSLTDWKNRSMKRLISVLLLT